MIRDGLRVRLLARDRGRHTALARMLEIAGHVLAVSSPGTTDGDDADVVLADIGPEEAPLTDQTLPTVLLTERPRAFPDIEAVLPRASAPAQIDAALRAAVAGLHVRAREEGFAPLEVAATPLLTPRELEILRAIGEGLSNKEVARRFGISAHTVKFHLEAVFAKLDAGTRAEAVAKGLRRGLIEI
jgi:two-component system, NarL family, nitrate/nitrite response regulator NarL